MLSYKEEQYKIENENKIIFHTSIFNKFTEFENVRRWLTLEI